MDVSGSVVLRAWKANDTDVAHTVTDTDWVVSDFRSGMDFAAISSYRAKSASVKGSNALGSADHNPTDVRLNYGKVDIVGPLRLRMPLDKVTTDVNPTAVRVDQMKIQKPENNKATVTSSETDWLVGGRHLSLSDRKVDEDE